MIYFFSGTGNSKWVAERLAAMLGDAAVDLIGMAGKEPPAFAKGQKVGLVFPIYAWRAPEAVESFARTLRAGDAYVYAVCTYWKNAGDALPMLGEILPLAAGFGLAMPANFVAGARVTKPAEARKMLERAGGRLDGIAQSIREERRVFDFKAGHLAWIKSHWIGPGFNAFARKTKSFHAEKDKCTACGLCASICPAKAIGMENGRPAWVKPTCFMCMGCINKCPAEAIQYGRNSAGRARYRFPLDAEGDAGHSTVNKDIL